MARLLPFLLYIGDKITFVNDFEKIMKTSTPWVHLTIQEKIILFQEVILTAGTNIIVKLLPDPRGAGLHLAFKFSYVPSVVRSHGRSST